MVVSIAAELSRPKTNKQVITGSVMIITYGKVINGHRNNTRNKTRVTSSLHSTSRQGNVNNFVDLNKVFRYDNFIFRNMFKPIKQRLKAKQQWL